VYVTQLVKSITADEFDTGSVEVNVSATALAVTDGIGWLHQSTSGILQLPRNPSMYLMLSLPNTSYIERGKPASAAL
jgi:hypothetical protein